MNAWIQLTSGRGPEECRLAVSKLMIVFQKECEEHKHTVDLIEAIESESYKGAYKSVLLSVSGNQLEQSLKSWEGTIQWIIESPYRKKHRRKNWFVGVNIFLPPNEGASLSTNDIRYEAIKASGPGGQHVNKTSSAIRATHLPTGLSTLAQEERSQLMNRKLATARLTKLISGIKKEQRNSLQTQIWHHHDNLERGNPVRTYKGKQMKRIK